MKYLLSIFILTAYSCNLIKTGKLNCEYCEGPNYTNYSIYDEMMTEKLKKDSITEAKEIIRILHFEDSIHVKIHKSLRLKSNQIGYAKSAVSYRNDSFVKQITVFEIGIIDTSNWKSEILFTERQFKFKNMKEKKLIESIRNQLIDTTLYTQRHLHLSAMNSWKTINIIWPKNN